MLELQRTYEEVEADVKYVLEKVGYEGIIDIDVFEHSDAESLEIHMNSYFKDDPKGLITGTTDNDVDYEHCLEDDKLFELVYGPSYTGYECMETHLNIEME